MGRDGDGGLGRIGLYDLSLGCLVLAEVERDVGVGDDVDVDDLRRERERVGLSVFLFLFPIVSKYLTIGVIELGRSNFAGRIRALLLGVVS